jgi:Ran GTPase-activating protein (RanGAP) involved in mRNA processing and transport
LRNNGLTTIGATHLAQALKRNTALSTVVLYEHHMEASGNIEIAKSLLQNNTLRDFELWGQVDKSCAAIYADVLRSNKTLTRLSLYKSEIDNDGAHELAKGLKGNTTLKVLNLHSNYIGGAGGRALAEALAGNITLSALNLENNFLSEEVKELLKQQASVNLQVTV